MKLEWKDLAVGDLFSVGGKLYTKKEDIGYHFGIMNSVNERGEMCWVDPYAKVVPMMVYTISSLEE